MTRHRLCDGCGNGATTPWMGGIAHNITANCSSGSCVEGGLYDLPPDIYAGGQRHCRVCDGAGEKAGMKLVAAPYSLDLTFRDRLPDNPWNVMRERNLLWIGYQACFFKCSSR